MPSPPRSARGFLKRLVSQRWHSRCSPSPCHGLDPVSWTRSERRIRCPRCSRRRSPGDHAGSLTRSSRPRAPCGWCSTTRQTVGRVARELDLTESALRTWVADRARADRTNGRTGLTTEEREELRRLRKEIRVLRTEREILKKRGRLLREGERVRFAFIHTEKARCTVQALCRALDVSPSGFYAWCRRPESAHAQRDRQLRVLIRASHEASRYRYGEPPRARGLDRTRRPPSAANGWCG